MVGRFATSAGERLSTLAIALVAILVSILTWRHYVTAPWTRSGSVRVQVANIAPQMSGKIVELPGRPTTEFVHRGDVLYVIEPLRLRGGRHLPARAALDSARRGPGGQAGRVRRGARTCPILATTPEEQQIFAGNAVQAKAAYAAAAARTRWPRREFEPEAHQ